MQQNPEVTPLVARLQGDREQLRDVLLHMDGIRSGAVGSAPIDIGSLTPAKRLIVQAGRTRVMLEIARIDAALERHANGSFGGCCRCELPIEAEHLAADPAAAMCSECVDEIRGDRRLRA